MTAHTSSLAHLEARSRPPKAACRGGLEGAGHRRGDPGGRARGAGSWGLPPIARISGSAAARWFSRYRSTVDAQPVYGFDAHAFYDGFLSVNVLSGGYHLRIAVVGPSNNLAVDELLMRDAPAKL